MWKTIGIIAFALGGWLTQVRSAYAAPDNVRLLYAQPFSYAASGFSWDQTYIYVHVRNVGSSTSRHVYVHYNNVGSWIDEELSLVGDYGDHSTYSVVHPRSKVEFAVKYVSSAGTYWDNHDGENYKVQPYTSGDGFLPGIVGGAIGLNQATVSEYAYFTGTGWALAARLNADIVLENLSYNKLVGLRYSVDGGVSWQDVAASYQYTVNTGGGQRIEHWSVQSEGLPRNGTIQYALYYRNLDWGTEYWDNNFYQNYAHALVTGTEIH